MTRPISHLHLNHDKKKKRRSGDDLHTSENKCLHPEPPPLVLFLTTHSHIVEEMTSTRPVCDFMEPEHSPEVLRLTFLITHTQREANHIKKRKREKGKGHTNGSTSPPLSKVYATQSASITPRLMHS